MPLNICSEFISMALTFPPQKDPTFTLQVKPRRSNDERSCNLDGSLDVDTLDDMFISAFYIYNDPNVLADNRL